MLVSGGAALCEGRSASAMVPRGHVRDGPTAGGAMGFWGVFEAVRPLASRDYMTRAGGLQAKST